MGNTSRLIHVNGKNFKAPALRTQFSDWPKARPRQLYLRLTIEGEDGYENPDFLAAAANVKRWADAGVQNSHADREARTHAQAKANDITRAAATCSRIALLMRAEESRHVA